MKALISGRFLALFALGLIIPAKTIYAQASNYKVEVVIFKHMSEQGKNSEHWIKPEHFKEASSEDDILYNSAAMQQQDSISASNNDAPVNGIQPALASYDMDRHIFTPLRNGLNELSSNQYKLANSAANIQQSKHFKLLAHFGWIQPKMSENRALPIMITKDPYDENMPEGEIRLYVSRFLHMNVDLAQTECIPLQKRPGEAVYKATSSSGSTTTYSGQTSECIEHTYQFKQRRKMRSKELHYLDNPVFGMLVYISPI